MASQPSLQFYPGDWLRDPVAGCSFSAQGLWLRLMIIMHDAPSYGRLALADGKPMPDHLVARLCGCSTEEYRSAFDELKSAGVPRFTQDGVIFSQRMVRDAEIREQWRTRQQRRRKGHTRVTRMSRRSSSSSSSSSSVPRAAAAAWEAIGTRPCGDRAFQEFWETSWAARNGERPSQTMGTCADAWEAAGGKVPGEFFHSLSRIRTQERDAESMEPDSQMPTAEDCRPEH